MKIEYIGKCLLLEEKGKKVLVVGDLHFGFEEALNNSGVFVVRKMFEEVKKEFEEVFEKIGKTDKVVLLGDVKHEFGRISSQEWKEILGLVDYFKEKCDELVVVKGNHDVMLSGLLKKKEVRFEKYYIWSDKVGFVHGDEDFSDIWNEKIELVVVGHAHPAVKIGNNVRKEKYKCFLEGKFKGKKLIIVPSFFDINEGSDLREYDSGLVWKINFGKFNVKVVGEKLEVMDFGKLEKVD